MISLIKTLKNPLAFVEFAGLVLLALGAINTVKSVFSFISQVERGVDLSRFSIG